MKKLSFLAIAMMGATLFASAKALAQTTVTNPDAAVPPVLYQSVFNESPTGVETLSIDWKKANSDVAQFKRGHPDILKWEEAEAKSIPNPASKPVVPAGTRPAEPAGQPPQKALDAPTTMHKH